MVGVRFTGNGIGLDTASMQKYHNRALKTHERLLVAIGSPCANLAFQLTAFGAQFTVAATAGGSRQVTGAEFRGVWDSSAANSLVIQEEPRAGTLARVIGPRVLHLALGQPQFPEALRKQISPQQKTLGQALDQTLGQTPGRTLPGDSSTPATAVSVFASLALPVVSRAECSQEFILNRDQNPTPKPVLVSDVLVTSAPAAAALIVSSATESAADARQVNLPLCSVGIGEFRA